MKEKTVYALGFFDGVHLGHQALLTRCRELAKDRNCRAGVVTFLGHPDTLVRGVTPGLINTPADRERLLRRYGMEEVVSLPFDKNLMTMPWQEFFALLLREYGAAGLVCGHDFRFGNRGQGNAAALQQVCREANIPCEVVPEQKCDGITVSSTYIRTVLEAGDVERAGKFLGHRHILTGRVVSGQGLGHRLGTPTANLKVPPDLVSLRHGVYICRASGDGFDCPAVTNIGMRPTVSGEEVTVEPWLLDFQGDLYGKELTLEFYRFLRPERKFPSVADLRQEILKNGEETRKYFQNI